MRQVDELQLSTCLRLVRELETGASGQGEVQALADKLLQRTGKQMATLLQEEGCREVLADGQLQGELLTFIGPWHDMLNCRLRRELWLALPFELLLVRPLCCCCCYCCFCSCYIAAPACYLP